MLEQDSAPPTAVKCVKQANKLVVDENDCRQSFIIYGSKDNEENHTADTVEDQLIPLAKDQIIMFKVHLSCVHSIQAQHDPSKKQQQAQTQESRLLVMPRS